MKYFSYEEAAELLPQIEKILSTALNLKRSAEEKMETLTSLERQPGVAPDKVALEKAQVAFLAQNIQGLLQQVQDLGAEVKGLDPALVDFPHRMRGREVYLCWRFGEKRIEYFHGIEEGFAGRKPFPDKPLTQ